MSTIFVLLAIVYVPDKIKRTTKALCCSQSQITVFWWLRACNFDICRQIRPNFKHVRDLMPGDVICSVVTESIRYFNRLLWVLKRSLSYLLYTYFPWFITCLSASGQGHIIPLVKIFITQSLCRSDHLLYMSEGSHSFLIFLRIFMISFIRYIN